jgi:hypothetical protein
MADTPHNVLVVGAGVRESATDLPARIHRAVQAQRNLCSLGVGSCAKGTA